MSPTAMTLLLRQVSTDGVVRVKMARGRWAWEIVGRAASQSQIEILNRAAERGFVRVPQPMESHARVTATLTEAGRKEMGGR